MNNILAHWKQPFNKGLQPGTHLGTARTDVCGDEITISLKVADDCVTVASWDGEGCTICLGFASLLTKWLIGKPLSAIKQLTEDRFFKLADVTIEKRRKDCALVAFKALDKALCNTQGHA